jgi:hypothetical protein
MSLVEPLRQTLASAVRNGTRNGSLAHAQRQRAWKMLVDIGALGSDPAWAEYCASILERHPGCGCADCETLRQPLVPAVASGTRNAESKWRRPTGPCPGCGGTRVYPPFEYLPEYDSPIWSAATLDRMKARVGTPYPQGSRFDPQGYPKPLHGYCEGCAQDIDRAEWRQKGRVQRGTDCGPRACETCGTTFTPTRSDGRYCSSACRQKAYRQRGQGETR